MITADSAAAELPSIRGFAVRRPLGRGGFADVWEAVRDEDSAPVAIKVGRADHPIAHERFRRDAEALKKVGPPHVPRFYQIGRLDDGRPFIAMERLFGSTLASALEKAPDIPDTQWALAVADAVLVALEVVHARGLIHRDLKPENIFLREPEAGVTLIDFGLTRSRFADGDMEALTRTGALVGTPEYMSPEQVRGDRALDARTDIYSFGVLFFELLTLRLPFVGERRFIEHSHQALRPPRPADIVPLPEKLSKIALACLEKEPGRRPQTAALIRRALADVAPILEASSPAPLDTSRPAPSRSAPASRDGRLLESARRPVVLLVLDDVGSDAAHLVAAVTHRKGIVARRLGGRYVCVFSGEDMDSPARIAALTAQELAQSHGARAALHLASLTVRRDRRGALHVYGAAVERPDSWLPAAAWSGVLMTSEVAQALSAADVQASSEHAGFFMFEPGDRASGGNVEASLVGRDHLLDAVGESIKSAFAGRSPALFTLIGEHGAGKSRLAREAISIARRFRPDADVIGLRAEQRFTSSAEPAIRELIAQIMDVDSSASGSELQRACRERLGDELFKEVWPSIAALSESPSMDGADRAASGDPRRRVMRVLAEALRRRARERPVVVVLDDAHWASDVLLDALEYATLDAPGCALWVLAAAHPRLESVRRRWGSRANRHDRMILGPLDEMAGMKLAAELLLPAEYPPASVLKRLWSDAGGNPACLVELTRTLKNAGIVRRRPELESYYVATAELEKLPPVAAWQWIAARKLDVMQPELAACVRFFSVFGVELSRAEVERVSDALEQASAAGAPLDIGYALGMLVERGVVRRGASDRYSFQSAVFRDSVYRLLDARQREEIHRRALDVWRSTADLASLPEERLERIAHHAAACGAREEAAEAYLRMGDSARAQHRHVEADQHYTSALAFLESDDARRRARALAGRGGARYRVSRIREALDDLRAARELSEVLSDDAIRADALLEEATALDFLEAVEASLARVEEARPIVERLAAPPLELRLMTALGRSYARQGRLSEAAELLGKAADWAKETDDYETRVIALLILSPTLALMGSLAGAEKRFDEVIALCAGAEDWLHLGAAYANRAYLWVARRLLERAMDDLRRAVELARQVGNPWSERIATYNVAEFLHWLGEEEEALGLARRARVLEERFIDRPIPDASLLIARIQAARGELEEAQALLEWIARTCPPDSSDPIEPFFLMLRLVFSSPGGSGDAQADASSGWDDIIPRSRGASFAEELLEMLYWRARTAMKSGRLDEAKGVFEEAESHLGERPVWRRRFAELGAELRPRFEPSF